MRVVYLANHGNYKNGADDSEGHVQYGLEKNGVEVIPIHESEAEKAISIKADWLLFHKGGPKIFDILPKVPYKKMFWYWDKVWFDRTKWMENILPLVDRGFMTDGTWLAGNPNPKLQILRQGVGNRNTLRGTPRPERYKGKIAFLGSVYGERTEFVKFLASNYPLDFQIYQNVYNRDLYDLCETIPIIVSPKYPMDDEYWSTRIYTTLGSRGFLIHPYLKGLDREYTAGDDYIPYETLEELQQQIDFYLMPDIQAMRNDIRQAGYEKTLALHTFTKRVEELLSKL